MTDCAKIRELLELSVDGETSPEQEQTIAAHLEACADCREYRAFLETIDDALRLDAEPPEGFTERVMDRVRVRSAASRPAKGRRYVRYGAMAAGFVAVLALALILPRTVRMGRSAADTAKSTTPESAMVTVQTPRAGSASGGADDGVLESSLMMDSTAEEPAASYADADEAYPEEAYPEAAEAESMPTPAEAAEPNRMQETAGNEAADSTAPQMAHAAAVPGEYANVVLIYDTQFPELLRGLPVIEEDGAVFVELTPELLEKLTEQGYEVVTFDGAEKTAAAALIY